MDHDERGVRHADEARASAFAGLVDRRALDAAYRYATLILGDRSDAEDATHDAALTAWRRFRDLRDPARFDAWFGRILVNACRDRLRARRRSPLALEIAPGAPEVDPSDRLARRDAIARGMQLLSADHREAVVLRYFADLTIDQIAARTGVGAGTVKSRLHYGLRQLRAAVGDEGDWRLP